MVSLSPSSSLSLFPSLPLLFPSLPLLFPLAILNKRAAIYRCVHYVHRRSAETGITGMGTYVRYDSLILNQNE